MEPVICDETCLFYDLLFTELVAHNKFCNYSDPNHANTISDFELNFDFRNENLHERNLFYELDFYNKILISVKIN